MTIPLRPRHRIKLADGTSVELLDYREGTVEEGTCSECRRISFGLLTVRADGKRFCTECAPRKAMS